MYKYFAFLLFPLFMAPSLFAVESPIYKEPPFNLGINKMVLKEGGIESRLSDYQSVYFEGGTVFEGDHCSFKLISNPAYLGDKKRFYYNIIEIDPIGIASVLSGDLFYSNDRVLYYDKGESPNVYVQTTIYRVIPPYGMYKYILMLSEINYNINLSPDKLIAFSQSILSGDVPYEFKDVYFDFLSLSHAPVNQEYWDTPKVVEEKILTDISEIEKRAKAEKEAKTKAEAERRNKEVWEKMEKLTYYKERGSAGTSGSGERPGNDTTLTTIIKAIETRGSDEIEELSSLPVQGFCSSPQNLYVQCPLVQMTKPLIFNDAILRGLEPITMRYNRELIQGTVDCLKDIQSVEVNGKQATVKMLRPHKFLWEKEISLEPGANELIIESATTDGFRTVQKISVDYVPGDKEKLKESSKNYLLVIGINKYLYWNKLKGALVDAQSFAEVMTNKYSFSNDSAYTITLYDEMATKRNIDAAFRMLINHVTEQDNVLIYFAGHGDYDPVLDEGYWIPVEGEVSQTDTYLPNSTVYKYLRALKSKHTVVITDACFSGAFYVQEDRGLTHIDKYEQFRSRWVFTSGRKEYVPDLLYGSIHSPFAHFLIKFLKNNNEDINMASLVYHVTNAVSNNSKQTPIAAPLKETGDEGGQFVFRLK